MWGIDAARGVALIGMMVVHAVPNTDWSTGESTLTGELFAGRSAALFAVLAGVGLALLTGGDKPDRPNARVSWDRRVVAVRAVLIIAIGMLVAMMPAGVAVILVHYGVLFLLALPFLRLGWRALCGLTIVWIALAPVIYWYVQNALRPGEPGAGTMTSPDRLWTSPSAMDLTDPYLLGLDLAVTGYYPLLLWPAYLFAGMAIGRLNLQKLRTALWLSAGGAVFAAVSWWLGRQMLERSGIVGRMVQISGWDHAEVRGELETGSHELPLVTELEWFLLVTPHQGSTVDLVHTISCAVAVVGLCLLLARLKWLIAPLAGAGSMPLSLYVGHLVVLALWRGTTADGQPWVPMPTAFEQLSAESMALWLVVAALALGLVKILVGRRGPLESLTYSTGVALAGPRP